MKLKRILFGTLCALMLAGTFTACDSENNEPQSKIALPDHRVFILCEGLMKSNNSTLGLYAPDKEITPSVIGDLYTVQNGKGLGDTAQDMIEKEGKLYVVVSASRRLVQLNKDGVELASLSFSEADGDPRYMVAKEGKLYVTLYSGQVARIDAASMKIEAYVTVGTRPEHIAELNGKLYVSETGSINGEGATVCVVDIASFKKEKEIAVINNPHKLLAAGGEMYVVSWGYWGAPTLGGDYTLQRIKADGTVESVGLAENAVYYNGTIYTCYLKAVYGGEEEGWALKSREAFLASYDVNTHTFSEQPFVTGAPAELFSSIIYSIGIDPANGDIYIGASADYTSTGDIYRFNASGAFLEQFDCGGIGPNKFLFL
jgi:hypothetical protein